MLTVAQLESNKKKFEETNEKYKIFTDELLKFLGDDYFVAPSSTHEDMFGCYPGGLLNISFKACKYAVQINELLPEKLRMDKLSILKSVFLSQIGKTHLFTDNPSDWHRKNLGKLYEYKNDMISMRIGERSAYYASQYGVKLTEEEYQAIINLDKDPDDRQAKFFSTPLTMIVKQGIELAIMEDKHGKKPNPNSFNILINNAQIML